MFSASWVETNISNFPFKKINIWSMFICSCRHDRHSFILLFIQQSFISCLPRFTCYNKTWGGLLFGGRKRQEDNRMQRGFCRSREGSMAGGPLGWGLGGKDLKETILCWVSKEAEGLFRWRGRGNALTLSSTLTCLPINNFMYLPDAKRWTNDLTSIPLSNSSSKSQIRYSNYFPLRHQEISNFSKFTNLGF